MSTENDRTPSVPQWVFEADENGQPQKLTGPLLERGDVVTLVPLDVLRAECTDRDRLASELAECREALAAAERDADLEQARASEKWEMVKSARSERDSARDALRQARPIIASARTVVDDKEFARRTALLPAIDAALGEGEPEAAGERVEMVRWPRGVIIGGPSGWFEPRGRGVASCVSAGAESATFLRLPTPTPFPEV